MHSKRFILAYVALQKLRFCKSFMQNAKTSTPLHRYQNEVLLRYNLQSKLYKLRFTKTKFWYVVHRYQNFVLVSSCASRSCATNLRYANCFTIGKGSRYTLRYNLQSKLYKLHAKQLVFCNNFLHLNVVLTAFTKSVPLFT